MGQNAAVQIMAGEITPGEAAGGEPAAVQTAPGETVAAATQLAIGLLTASLDSLALESWAVEALTPHDAARMALADFAPATVCVDAEGYSWESDPLRAEVRQSLCEDLSRRR